MPTHCVFVFIYYIFDICTRSTLHDAHDVCMSHLFYPTNRELLLNNNLLRVLPNEIGKLFHIHILGLHGNPLQKDLQSIYNEPNGTQKLLTYLLDNLSCKF